MTNYFRITGYCPENDYCFIVDCYGMFEKLWQFSSMLIQKGLKIIEVSNMDNVLDVNIDKLTEIDADHIILRANANGQPENISQEKDGVTYKAIKVANKIYIPDKNQTI